MNNLHSFNKKYISINDGKPIKLTMFFFLKFNLIKFPVSDSFLEPNKIKL